MLEIYKGIKIEDEVIIVEKQNDDSMHQGYLVNINNKSQLENALNWAKFTRYIKDANGDNIATQWYYYDEQTHNRVFTDNFDDCINKTYYVNKYLKEELDGIVHKYKNGKFELSLNSAAERSSQGGKLSFWNCVITAPDNKQFLIGINQECLISLLLNNTFENGECQDYVWLGRVSSNVGAFTKNMDEFEQGKKDKNIRTSKKTTKYDVGSTLIPSNRVYCGEFYKLFDVFKTKYNYNRYSNSDKIKYFINIFSTPKKVYLYKKLYCQYGKQEDSMTQLDYEQQVHNNRIYVWDFVSNKVAGVVSEHKINIDTDKMLLNSQQERDKLENNYALNKELLCSELIQKQFNKDIISIEDLCNFFNKYDVSYGIDMSEEDLLARDFGQYQSY